MTPPPRPPPQPVVLPPSRVLVAGATGWLGTAVVRELVRRGYEVVALARDPASAAARELLESLKVGGGKGSVVVAEGDVTDAPSLLRAVLKTGDGKELAAGGVSAVISCVGMRDLAVPDAEIAKVLKTGTLNLYAALEAAEAAAGASSLFVAVAGGIHRLKDGSVNREMVHNAMREEALEELAGRRRAGAEEAAARRRSAADEGEGGGTDDDEETSSPPLPPAVVAIDPSVFFKDAATIFSMIRKSVTGSKRGKLTLVEGSWEVRSNPISARDLASRLADALVDQREASPSPSAPASLRSPVRRFRVGGPQVVSFAELAEEAGRALGGVAVEKKSIRRPLAQTLYLAASLLSLFPGFKRALAAKRFLSFLWVVGTDESPGSLVGDERCGGDTLSAFFEELGAEEERKRGGGGGE